ncbi:MAG: polysaccharide biosynthesis/export family protein, partial [Candidatus Rokuibacteriota bacterium]
PAGGRGPVVAVPPPPDVSREAPTLGSGGDYKLAPKDQLTVTVHGQDDLTRTVRVSQTGTITLPLLGEVKAAGQTAKALEDAIESGLRGRYLKHPKVNVAVAEYQGRQVSVLGAVNQPGAYGLKSNATTVLAALSEARGVKDTADRVAYVVRATPRPGEPQPLPVDLEGLLRSGDVRQNVVLEGGDTVFIPEANQYYVAGEVEKRGAYTLRRGTTVSKALTEAGGVTKRASGEVTVVRTLPTGEKRELPPIDLAAAMQGDRTQDVELQAQDVVMVPAHGAKVAAYGVLDFLKGLFSIGIMP